MRTLPGRNCVSSFFKTEPNHTHTTANICTQTILEYIYCLLYLERKRKEYKEKMKNNNWMYIEYVLICSHTFNSKRKNEEIKKEQPATHACIQMYTYKHTKYICVDMKKINRNKTKYLNLNKKNHNPIPKKHIIRLLKRTMMSKIHVRK